jgi:Na+-driven multidrug efflux pump
MDYECRFLFDNVYTWAFFIPYAYVLTHFTTLDIMMLYPVCNLADIIKCIIGLIIVKAGNWAQNMVLGTASNERIEPNADVL